MEIIQIIISTLIASGVVGIIIKQNYDKQLKAHELKLGRYLELIKELSKLIGNVPDWKNLGILLNEALLFSSDEVAVEILNFNELYTQKQKASSNGNFLITANDLKPLIIKIRSDLYLESYLMEQKELAFFFPSKN